MSIDIHLLVIIKDNLIQSKTRCRDDNDLEERFKKECSDYGVEACDENMEDRYMKLECGTTICMVWA